MCIESVELIVAFKLSELSNTKGIPNNSTSSELLAVKDFVFNIQNKLSLKVIEIEN